MAQEKIIIKFEADGHPELIAAIKKLNVETKKLTGAGGLGGTTQAVKKLSPAFYVVLSDLGIYKGQMG